MSDTNRDKMVRWIRKQLGTSGELLKLVLRHASGAKTAAVCELDVDQKTTAEDYASSVMLAATDDANGLGGIHKYSLASYFADRIEAPRERFSFRIIAEENDEDGMDALSTEDGNAKGLLAQMMRHNEAIMRTSVMGTNDLIRHYQQMVSSQMNRNSELEERHTHLVGMIEEVSSLKHERDIASLRAASDMKRKDDLVEKGMLLLPSVVNKLTGKKLLPEEITPEKATLVAFGKSLTPDQLEKFQAILKPEQLIAILSLLDSVMKAEEKPSEKGPVNGKTGEA